MPRRSTVSSVDDGGLGGLQRLEIWTGKSQAPERFGILLRLWSLLLRRQGLARVCSMFSRVLFSFLSPLPLNCLRVCGLSLPLFLSPSLSHHLSLPPSTRVNGRVGRWRGGVRGGGGRLRACGWWAGGGVRRVHETRARVRAWTGRDRDVPPNSAQRAYTLVCGGVRESRCVSESVCIWDLGGVSGGAQQ